MHMVNAFRKPAYKLHRIHALPKKMARIERETKLLTAIERIQGHLSGVQIECHLPRMNLGGKPDTTLATHIQDGMPLSGELLIPVCDHGSRWSRIAGDIGPQGRTREAAHHRDSQFLRSPDRGHHLFDSPLANTARVAIAPNVVW